MLYTLQITPFCARTPLFLAIATALYLVSSNNLCLSTAAKVTEHDITLQTVRQFASNSIQPCH